MTTSETSALVDEPAPFDDPRTFVEYLLGDLVIDPDTQRETDPERVQRIAHAFDWLRFECPTVVPIVEGRARVIEGQHRVMALRTLAPLDTVVTCAQLPIDVDPITEANIAYDIARGRRAHSAFESWQLRVTMGHEHEVIANAVLARRHLRLGRRPAPQSLACVATVTTLIHGRRRAADDGAALLGRTVDVLGAAFPADEEASGSRSGRSSRASDRRSCWPATMPSTTGVWWACSLDVTAVRGCRRARDHRGARLGGPDRRRVAALQPRHAEGGEDRMSDMDASVARATLERAQRSVADLSRDLIALRDGRAWLALGYVSWIALVEHELRPHLALSRADREVIMLELSASGMADREIACVVEVAPTTVGRSRRTANVGRSHSTIDEDEARRDAVVELYAAGYTRDAIARACHVSNGRIDTDIEVRGIAKRSRGAPVRKRSPARCRVAYDEHGTAPPSQASRRRAARARAAQADGDGTSQAPGLIARRSARLATALHRGALGAARLSSRRLGDRRT